LTVLRTGRAPHAHRLADDERHARLSAEHVARLRGLVHQFVDRAQREVGIAHFRDRTGADERGADRCAHDARFGNRGVADSTRPELFNEAFVLTEDAAAPEVFAECPDERVAPHLLGQSELAGLEIVHARHVAAPISCTSSHA
jgi:hypothetical protein